MLKLTRYLLVILTLGFGSFAKADVDADLAAQSKGTFVFVTGPNLGLDNSATVCRQTEDLAKHLQSRLPDSQFQIHHQFSKANLAATFSALRENCSSDMPITLLINAHGCEYQGKYYIQSHAGYLTSQDLADIVGDCNVTIALLTCHSGAFDVSCLKKPVFGSSSNQSVTLESHFTNWIQEVKTTSCTLLRVGDFYNTWGKAVAKTSTTQASNYPYWFAQPQNDDVAIMGSKMIACAA